MSVKKIAVLTSGGDAPGMNACIRAVYLAARNEGIDVIGYQHGYNGLLKQDYVEFAHKDIRNLIQRGGTVLYSARCEKFKNEENEYDTHDCTIMNIFPCVFVFIHMFLYYVHFGENRTPLKISFSNQ